MLDNGDFEWEVDEEKNVTGIGAVRRKRICLIKKPEDESDYEAPSNQEEEEEPLYGETTLGHIKQACLRQEDRTTVHLSRQPLLLMCQDNGLKRQVIMCYWPDNEAVGQQLVRRVTACNQASGMLLEALIMMAAGELVVNLEQERVKAARQLIFSQLPLANGTLDAVGRLTFYWHTKGGFASQGYTGERDLTEAVSNHGLKSMMDDDFEQDPVMHIVFCLLADPPKKTSAKPKNRKFSSSSSSDSSTSDDEPVKKDEKSLKRKC